jgi:hypothetical protein
MILVADIQRIAFYDDELYVIVDERTGKEYVLPKPMVDMFGLDWPGQLRKLKRNQIFSKGMDFASIPSDGGPQEMVLLERRLVHAWLLSINSTRVAPTYRDKLLRYQQECADVLDAYFTKGVAVNPRTQGDMLVEMALAWREQERRIAVLEAQDKARDKALIEAQARAIEALTAAQQANTKADLALEDAHRMTIEQYVIKNGLTHQYPPSSYKRMSAWLLHFCEEWGLECPKVPVYGKAWSEENAYPLSAFGAFGRHETQRLKTVRLVKLPDETPAN